MGKSKEVTIQVLLKCPDGLIESLSYDLPSQIDTFINFINIFSKGKDYTITLKKFVPLETIAKLKYELRGKYERTI